MITSTNAGEESIESLRARVADLEAKAFAEQEAIPPLPANVGDGGAETMILVLLELRTKSADPYVASAATADIERMAARKVAQEAFRVGLQTEYSNALRLLRKRERMAKGYPA